MGAKTHSALVALRGHDHEGGLRSVLERHLGVDEQTKKREAVGDAGPSEVAALAVLRLLFEEGRTDAE